MKQHRRREGTEVKLDDDGGDSEQRKSTAQQLHIKQTNEELVI